MLYMRSHNCSAGGSFGLAEAQKPQEPGPRDTVSMQQVARLSRSKSVRHGQESIRGTRLALASPLYYRACISMSANFGPSLCHSRGTRLQAPV